LTTSTLFFAFNDEGFELVIQIVLGINFEKLSIVSILSSTKMYGSICLAMWPFPGAVEQNRTLLIFNTPVLKISCLLIEL